MEKIFVTESGYLLLLKKKEELIYLLRKSQFDKGTAASGDSNSWHDNSDYEMHARNEMMLAEQVSEIIQQIEKLVIIEAPKNNTILGIGHTAVLIFQDSKTTEYAVAGFGESDMTTNPKKLSYDSPILNQFIGKPVGHSALIAIKGKDVEITLREII